MNTSDLDSPVRVPPVEDLLVVDLPAVDGATTDLQVPASGSWPTGILGLALVAPEPVIPGTKSVLDRVALGLAVVVAPLGLVAGVVAAVLSARRHGYVSGLARAAIVVSLALSVVLAAGGVAYSFAARAQAHERALQVNSIPLCAMVAAAPTRMTDPAFGWPAITTTIAAYEQEVAAYSTWWTKLASVAPAPVHSQVVALATVARASNSRMMLSKVIEHDLDYADMQKAAAISTLPTWVKTYCN